jgi:hypothetical protein
MPEQWQPDPTGAASWRVWDGSAWGSGTAPGWETGHAPLGGAVGRELLLDQDAEGGADLLGDGEVVVASLAGPAYGTAVGHSATGSWRFDPQGMAQQQVQVVVLPGEAVIARFGWEGLEGRERGALRLSDGRVVPLERQGTEKPANAWGFLRPDGSVAVSARLDWPQPKTKNVFGREITFTASATGGRTFSDVYVDVRATPEDVTELPLLVVLVSYLARSSADKRDRRGRMGGWS